VLLGVASASVILLPNLTLASSDGHFMGRASFAMLPPTG
jgi:hypothetical protein